MIVTLEQMRCKLRKVGLLHEVRINDIHMLTTEDFAKIVKVANSTVITRIHQNKLVGVKLRGRQFLIPSWAQHPPIKKALPAVIKVLGKENPWSVINFFELEKVPGSDKTPIDYLREGGDINDVIEHAKNSLNNTRYNGSFIKGTCSMATVVDGRSVCRAKQ